MEKVIKRLRSNTCLVFLFTLEIFLAILINMLLIINTFSHQRIVDIWLCVIVTLLMVVSAFLLTWSGPNKEWRNEKGKRHRLDGPAVEFVDGSKWWYVNGRSHRLDGPAIEWNNGSKEWYEDGKCHRIDGPAIKDSNGNKYWYLYDKGLSEDLHTRLTGDIEDLPLYLGMGFDDYISERLKRKNPIDKSNTKR